MFSALFEKLEILSCSPFDMNLQRVLGIQNTEAADTRDMYCGVPSFQYDTDEWHAFAKMTLDLNPWRYFKVLSPTFFNTRMIKLCEWRYE